MTKTRTDYAFRIELDLPYKQAIQNVTEALKEEGFGILTTVDVKSTLKQKLGVDFRKYAILGACNPKLAYQALNAELEVGLLLPCTVIVYEEKDGSVVSIADPIVMLGTLGKPDLEPLAREVQTRLQRVVEALNRSGG